MTQGKVSTGHPVDVASGVVFTAWHDIDVPGVVPLLFRRYYSTALLDAPGRLFRHGWVYSLEMMLTRIPGGYLLWGPEGSSVTFDDPGGLVDAGEPAWAFGDFMRLQRRGNDYVVYHWHDWREDVQKFIFSPGAAGAGMPICRLEIPSGNALLFEYDPAGRLREVRQSVEGRALRMRYDQRDVLVELMLHPPTGGPQSVATYEYDGQERLIVVRDAFGAPMHYAYGPDHRMIEEVGRGGASYRMSYDASGRGIGIGGQARYQHRDLVYDDAKSTTRVTDSLGHVTTYRWNGRGQITEQTSPTGAVERTTFDGFGRIIARCGPSGEVLSTTYSQRGNTESIAYPGGGFVAFEYNLEHQPTLVRRGNGAQISFEYVAGAVVTSTGAGGDTTRYERDAANLVTRIVSSAGAHIDVTRDAHFSTERYEDESGLLRQYHFDARLNVTQVDDARGLLRRFEFDRCGNLIADHYPNGHSRRYTRDGIGRPATYTDRSGSVTRHAYDLYGNRAFDQDPQNATVRYRWDSEGRLIEVLNAKDEKASFGWDPVGNLTSICFFDGRTERFEYDLSSRRTARIKADGTRLDFAYDIAGNFLGTSKDGAALSTNAYDPDGQLVETVVSGSTLGLRYDRAGRLVAENQNGLNVETTFAPSGLPTSRVFGGAKMPRLQFEHDHRRRLVLVSDDKDEPVSSYAYDASNLVTHRTFAGLTERFTYDVLRRLESQTVVSPSGNVLVRRAFAYDPNDQLVRVVDMLRGTFEFEYDANSRLTRSTGPGAQDNRFAYDACGNLIHKSGVAIDYAPGNRLLAFGAARYERDVNGNTTAVHDSGTLQLHWNDFDQLAASVAPDGARTEYTYDGLGRRIAVDREKSHVLSYWSARDLICELTETSTVDYFIGNFVPQTLWINGTVRHLVLTHALQPGEWIDATGSVVWTGDYDAWGRPGAARQETGVASKLGFPGQHMDLETGLHYNRFRYYDSKVGRYLTPDPLGLAFGLNEYLYGVNPVNWVDPLGLACGQTHFTLVENPNLQGRGGQAAPTRADWIAKRDAFNAMVEAHIAAGTPLTIPTPAQYAADRAVGNSEARAARVAQGMGPGVQADHPVELAAGGGQGQTLYPLASGVNGSSGGQLGPQAAARNPGSPTPMVDLVDQQGRPIP